MEEIGAGWEALPKADETSALRWLMIGGRRPIRTNGLRNRRARVPYSTE